MKSILKNNLENRLRAGWRILFFLPIFWVFSSSILVIKPLFGEITKREYLANYSLVLVTILAISATIAVPLARKFFDKRSFQSLGLKINSLAFKELGLGFLLSALMAALFYFILISFGLIEFNGFNLRLPNELSGKPFNYVQFMQITTIGSLSLLLLEHILVGYWEELVFRGYLFQNMVEGMGIRLAIALSCLIYGLVHYTNPNAGWLSSSIIVLFGFLRIYGYTSTKMLWLSIGMHIGWNFFQGPIFGFAASGHKTATLINHKIISEQSWLTGGEFGPEGSVLIIPIIALALYIMHLWSKKKT